ncbi:MAG: hypothetical protein Q3983_00625 [Capnocytophaga sp.]|nr:hypothetical protein [Capnocytophaga sp.]
MKTFIFLCSFWGFSSFCFSQQNTDYQYIILPKQFNFQKEVNQYNINTLSKFLLEKKNLQCVWDDKIPENFAICDGLRFNVINKSNLFKTKVIATLSDCKGNIVYTSPEGQSREKDFKKGYNEALREALANINLSSIKKVIKNEEKEDEKTVKIPDNPLDRVQIQESSSLRFRLLTFQESNNKILLLNDKKEEIFSLQKTSLENVFQAVRKEDSINGIFFKKDNYFVFEYNKNGEIIHDFYEVNIPN